MLLCKKTTVSALTLSTFFVCQAAGALGIRLDSGDWDTVFTGNSSTVGNVGFTMDFEMSFAGISGNAVSVDSAGSLRLFDTGTTEFAEFNPFFDLDQTSDGRTTSFTLEETNAAFSVTGIDAGFRATWSVFDAGGALLNQFQVALFALSGGQFALEFNYDLLTFGDDGTDIGYSTTLSTSFDLLSETGVPIVDALGAGDFDPTFPDLCPSTPDALACNNFYAGNFGPSDLILPDAAGGYFRSLSGSDSTPVQGRYLFLTGDVVVDSDGDGVLDGDDLCPDTVIPEESVPTRRLLVNRWALVDDDGIFDTVAPRRGPGVRPEGYSIEDTAGCSCEEIIPQLLDPIDQQGHLRHGCSVSLMDEWLSL